MAAVCEVCGKHPSWGLSVSHSHVRTKRRWNPNIQRVRALVNGSPDPPVRVHVVHQGRQGHQGRPVRRDWPPMQGVVKAYDPGTGEGVLVRDTDLSEYDLAGDALGGFGLPHAAPGPAGACSTLDDDGRATRLRLGSEVDMGTPGLPSTQPLSGVWTPVAPAPAPRHPTDGRGHDCDHDQPTTARLGRRVGSRPPAGDRSTGATGRPRSTTQLCRRPGGRPARSPGSTRPSGPTATGPTPTRVTSPASRTAPSSAREREDDAGPTNNWRDPAEMRGRADGALHGRHAGPHHVRGAVLDGPARLAHRPHRRPAHRLRLRGRLACGS